MTTRILFESLGRHHSLYEEIIGFPPDDFEFVIGRDRGYSTADYFRRTAFPKMLALEISSGLVPPSLAASILSRRFRKHEEYPLVFSAGHLVHGDEDWIVDCEHMGQFVGYNAQLLPHYGKLIERILSRERCKKILPWSDMARSTIEKNIKSKEVLAKIRVMRLSRHTTEFIKKKHETLRLLFIGSSNFQSTLSEAERTVLEGVSSVTNHCAFLAHENFYSKGGLLALEAFSRIAERYDDVELVVRSYVPPEIEQKYRECRKIRILRERLSDVEMDNLFASSDVFLFPSHMTPGMAFLDAMNYELPIVTLDACNNTEIVRNDVNGIVCNSPRMTPYWFPNGLPAGASYEHLQSIRTIDQHVVQEIVAAVSRLIESPSEASRLGGQGKRMLADGPFSIKTRNHILREVLEESLPR